MKLTVAPVDDVRRAMENGETYELQKKMNVNNVNFNPDMAMVFLDDADAVENKLASYYENVVRHN